MAEINHYIKKLIEQNAVALATIDKSGKPHCIAVGDVKVISKNQVLIGDNYMRETIKNIKQNNKVALVVWSRNWQKNCVGYELRGTTRYFTQGKWASAVKKIHKGFPAKGAILITINKIKKLA